MNQKILTSFALIAATGVIATGATYSFMHSVRQSTQNVFAAGNFELSLSSGNGYHADDTVIIGSNTHMVPGADAGTYDLYFKNTGEIDGKLKVNLDYTPREVDTNADLFAQKMVVKSAIVKHEQTSGTEVAGYWAQQIIDEKYPGAAAAAVAAGAVVSDNGTGYWPTIYGLKQITLYFWNSYDNKTDMLFAPNSERSKVMNFWFDKTADENYMGRGIDIKVTATMWQFNSDEDGWI